MPGTAALLQAVAKDKSGIGYGGAAAHLGGGVGGQIGGGAARLDHADALRRQSVRVPGDDDTVHRHIGPGALDRDRHAGRRLADGDWHDLVVKLARVLRGGGHAQLERLERAHQQPAVPRRRHRAEEGAQAANRGHDRVAAEGRRQPPAC